MPLTADADIQLLVLDERNKKSGAQSFKFGLKA